MPTSRYLRTAVRTATVAGGTSVGGATTTVLSIMPDGTVRFIDRFGITRDVPMRNGTWTGGFVPLDRNATPSLELLVDVLLARLNV